MLDLPPMSQTTQVLIRTSLLRQLERALPHSLRGGRKHRTRVEHVLEHYLRDEQDRRTRKAG